MEQAQEPATEPEAERHGALRLVRDRGIVEVELLQRVPQERVVRAGERIEPREHEALRLLVAGERLRRGLRHRRHGVTHLGLTDVLQTGGNVADLARREDVHRDLLRAEEAELQQLGLGPARHEADGVVVMERAGCESHVADDAFVGVVVTVEHERTHGIPRIALRRRDPSDDRLQDLGDPGALLGRGEDDLLARDREDVLELVHHRVGLGGRQVDLVEDRDDRESLAECEVDVGQRLRLDPLRCVDDQDGALTCLEASTDLVGEVDVAGRVDQVQAVDQAVVRQVLEADGAGLDRDALLALQVHRVEDLTHHLAAFDRVGQLQEAVCERGLAVVDVGDDREVAQAGLGYRGGHGAGV